MNIRVLLVDDHVIFRQALSHMLSVDPTMQVVGELGDGEQIVKTVGETRPDVVVMDVSMPKVNGMEATRKLLASHPQVKVVALSGFNYKQFVLEMLEAGVTGYVIKSAAAQQLTQAIVSAAAGQRYLCPESSELLISAKSRTAQSHVSTQGNKRLGKRETAVLKLLALGNSSPQIGNALHIATSTVDVHRRNIMRKLELHNVAELTTYAIRNGFVDLQGG
ncbi:MAG: response regulator transcription factor [Rhodoferax sp.]|jgi:two-component system NarL family response regulator|nr:response regulator transcription factor [Rhodoferax sp.]